MFCVVFSVLHVVVVWRLCVFVIVVCGVLVVWVVFAWCVVCDMVVLCCVLCLCCFVLICLGSFHVCVCVVCV